MTTIRRTEFLQQNRLASVDLNAVRNDPAKRAALEQAGVSVDVLARVVDQNGDGHISGRELGKLFDQADRFDNDGNVASLVATDRAGNLTASGQVLSTLGLLSANQASEEPAGPYEIQHMVGAGGHNKPGDVRAMQQKLKELGFDTPVNGRWGQKSDQALRTYQAMLSGNDYTNTTSGKVMPGDSTDQALRSGNPPAWTRMTKSGEGFVNSDRDGYSYGAKITDDVIADVGKRYAGTFLQSKQESALININDVSTRNGGKTRDHDTHQNGLDIDVRLPRHDGSHGSKVGWKNYDREATYAQIKAFAEDPRVDRILFTDPKIVQMATRNREPWLSKLQDGGDLHKDHFHVDVKPPVVQ